MRWASAFKNNIYILDSCGICEKALNPAFIFLPTSHFAASASDEADAHSDPPGQVPQGGVGCKKAAVSLYP